MSRLQWTWPASKAAQTGSDNSFAAQAPVQAGTTDVTVTATDPSGNVRTNTYRVSTSGAGTTYSYDLNGNLATKTEGSDSWVYSWNAENQLTKVEKNSVEQARFAYDPLNRRVEKVAAGVTTTYTYDEKTIAREQRAGTTLTYVHGPSIDEPLAVDDGTSISYSHADGLGSVVRLTSSAGMATLTRQYDAWGRLETGAAEPGYAFTGREWDPEVALYYYRARYYDPSTARFSGEDPIGFDGGNNFYSYVGNGPTTWTDPLGLDAGSGMQPNMFKPTCLDLAFKKGQRLGGAIGYRYGHCMAACEARKCGYSPQVVKGLGYANEWAQTATCFIDGPNCHSARAPINYEDNRVGFSCPDERTCEEQCSVIERTPKKTREQYGPHCKGPCREKDY